MEKIIRCALALAILATLFATNARAEDPIADWNQFAETAVKAAGHAPPVSNTKACGGPSLPAEVVTRADADQIVTFWNLTGINTILATPLGPRGAPLASRAMAMMHVAMADAVFSIHPKYEPYAVRITGHRNANKSAAAAAAAYGVLVRLFPAQQAALYAALAQSLAQVEDGRGKDQAVALGDEVAAQIVALRSNDGSDAVIVYTPPVGLGFWQPDPRTGPSPFLSWAFVTPWTMANSAQFRPEPPPSISSRVFAEDLAELKAIGGTTSAVRTLQQECIARFATDNPVVQYHRLARVVATAVPSDLEHNVRAFALFSVALADAFVSSFEAKFTYDFWRPWTAIQNAGAIGLPDLQDSTWLSLIPTPPHPEYPANHGVQSAAVVTVLKHMYGADLPAVTLTCQGVGCRADICPATFTSGHLEDFKELFGVARIYAGIHYRHTIEVSWAQGDTIAFNAINNFYRLREDEVDNEQ
jgi:PAP2 superfamily